MLTFQLIDGRQQVFQWETDRVIKLIGFTSCEYVNFFNPYSDDEAYTVEPFDTDEGDLCVKIPNEILQFDKKVRFYICGTDEYGKYVQLDGVINVVARQKPADYVYEPSDVLTFQKILEAAEAYKNAAKESADAAKTSENNAKASENVAKEKADLVVEKESQFSQTVTQATETFNENAEAKTGAYNDNHTTKLGAYNENASEKLGAYNENHEEKVQVVNQKAGEASDSADEAEKWAKGTVNGTAVPDTDEAHNNNAKYFMQMAQQAMQTAQQKAEEAASSKGDAETAKTLAQKYANAPENEIVETIDGVPMYSALHWMKKAEQAANSPLATPEVAGRAKLYDDLDGYNEDGSVTQKAIHDALDEFEVSMKQPLPSPEVEFIIDTARDTGKLYLKTNYTGAFGSVKVVMTPSNADPSATDTEVTVAGTTVTANDNWQITAIQQDESSMYSNSLTSVVEITMLKTQKPQISFQKATKKVWITCGTAGATIRYTTNATEPNEQSTLYSGEFTISTSTTVKAKAWKDGIVVSDTESMLCQLEKVWAVRKTLNSSPTPLTRLTKSSDPLGVVTDDITVEPVPEITGSQEGSSPFDGTEFWDSIRRRNFNDNGTPDVWEGEDGFDTSNKDTMVYFPFGWYKIVQDGTYRYYYLADMEISGFKLHPGSGQYIGAFETSNNNQSRAGKTVQVSQTRATMRTNARAKGAGWQLQDAAERNFLNLLYLIEYADTNCQAKIGAGISSSSKQQTGQTEVMSYHTGRIGGTDAAAAVRYRWVENPWGNVFEWTDGANFIDRVPYYSTDRDSYADDTTTGYTKMGGSNPGDGWIKEMRYLEELDWNISQPDTIGGSETSYWPDYHYYGSGNRVLAVGGFYFIGTACGLFYWNCNFTSTYAITYFGSRLSYKAA